MPERQQLGIQFPAEQNISLFTTVTIAALRTTKPSIKWTLGGGGVGEAPFPSVEISGV